MHLNNRFMEKIDFRKHFADFYSVPKNKIVIVDVPEMNYLAVDGIGDPNISKPFQEAIEALFSLSYTLKTSIKSGSLGIDYGVMPLEGQWWMDDMKDFSMDRKDEWKWSAMIMQPDFITNDMVDKSKKDLSGKKNLAALHLVRLENFFDGLCAQILHIGPYSEEPPTITKLHNYIHENGYELTGRHREIYLNDMRRTAPEKLKTIIRQPICKL